MKKILSNKFFKIVIILVLVLVLCFTVFRIVNKDICTIADIVTHHIHIHSDYFSDFINHTFHLAEYANDYNTGEKHMYVAVKTHDDISYILEHIKAIRDEINNYLSKNTIDKDVSEIEIWIENRAQCRISLQIMSDTIIVLRGTYLTFNEMLIQCKGFENIIIAGYKGWHVEITEPVDEELFSGFTKLKSLKIEDIETKEMVQVLEKAVSKLRENNVDVILMAKHDYGEVSDDQ